MSLCCEKGYYYINWILKAFQLDFWVTLFKAITFKLPHFSQVFIQILQNLCKTSAHLLSHIIRFSPINSDFNVPEFFSRKVASCRSTSMTMLHQTNPASHLAPHVILKISSPMSEMDSTLVPRWASCGSKSPENTSDLQRARKDSRDIRVAAGSWSRCLAQV